MRTQTIIAIGLILFVIVAAALLLSGCAESKRFGDPFDTEREEYKKLSDTIGKVERLPTKVQR